MIPGHVAIYFATGPVDLRWSFDVLSGVVKERIGQDPRAGAIFVFLNKRRTGSRRCSTTGPATPSSTSDWTAGRFPCRS